MQGQDSILQLVSSASFCRFVMLICRWQESYGGHYGPVFAEFIEAQNAKNEANTTNISLKTMTIINGWINPLIQVGCHDSRDELIWALINENPVRCLLQLYGIYPFAYGVSYCMDLTSAGFSWEHI